MTTPLGRLLRQWRALRRVSQQQLALLAQVAPRHLSFVESGRSRPGEAVVLRLAQALSLGPRDTNALLEAAGLEPRLLPATPRPTWEAHRRVIDAMLGAHAPFPALVMDRSWNLLQLNDPAACLFGLRAPLPAAEVIALLYGPGPLRASMLNWPAVAWAGADRLRWECRAAGDPPEMLAALRLAESHLRGQPRPFTPDCAGGLAVCPIFRVGEAELRTLSTLTRFVGAPGAELDELRIEHIFPADPDSEALLRRLAQSPSPVGLTLPRCEDSATVNTTVPRRDAPAMVGLTLGEAPPSMATDR